jgi:hypothetical protein
LPFPILGKYPVGFFQTVECSHFNNVALDRRIRYASTAVLFEEEFVLDCLVLFIDRSYRFPTFPPEGKESAVVWAESAYFVSYRVIGVRYRQGAGICIVLDTLSCVQVLKLLLILMMV